MVNVTLFLLMKTLTFLSVYNYVVMLGSKNTVTSNYVAKPKKLKHAIRIWNPTQVTWLVTNIFK